ncbi:MAG: hypothetical protein GY795_29895 [Desulfobacterales bacterium]|nr:hypothetical protein [Desulfobacterales bacterium]
MLKRCLSILRISLSGMLLVLNAPGKSYIETSDFTAFDLKRLKKKAGEIKEHVDIADGFALLGMIACLENDENNMRSYSERAIQQSGGNILHMVNYSKSLKFFGLKDESYELAAKAHINAPSDLNTLEYLIVLACESDRREEYLTYLNSWHKLTDKKHLLEEKALIVYTKGVFYFLKEYSNSDNLPEKHICPEDILKECSCKLTSFFGTPIKVITRNYA